MLSGTDTAGVLVAAGGQEVEPVDLQCSFGDIPCVFVEGMARAFQGVTGWLVEVFLGGSGFSPGQPLYAEALSNFRVMLGLAVVLGIALGAIGMAWGALTLSPQTVLKTFLSLFFLIPASGIAIYAGSKALEISDEMSKELITRISGDQGLVNLFIGYLRKPDGSFEGNVINNLSTLMPDSGVQYGVRFLIMLVLIILGLTLNMFALAFRDLMLMILFAFAPLAFLLVTLRGNWAIVRKWALAVFALVMAKPLLLGVIAMLLSVAGSASGLAGSFWTITFGLVVCSFMPFIAYNFFNFLGADSEASAGGAIPQSAKAGATSASMQQTQIVSLFRRRGAAGAGAAGAAGGAGVAGVAGAAAEKIKQKTVQGATQTIKQTDSAASPERNTPAPTASPAEPQGATQSRSAKPAKPSSPAGGRW